MLRYGTGSRHTQTMGLRSKMLAIAAWRLFLFLPSVVSQGPNINSSVIPRGFRSTVTVQLSYDAGPDLLPPLCGQIVKVPMTNETVNLNAPKREVVRAAQVRTPPRVLVTGLNASQTYTYLVVDVSSQHPIFGTRDKPFIYEMRVNVVLGDTTTGAVVIPYVGPLPEWGQTAEVQIFFFSQPSVLSDYSLYEYVETECGFGLRCAFHLSKFIEDKGLDLAYAGGFEVSLDESAIVASSIFGEKIACHRLVQYRLQKNRLIGDAELKVGLKVRFVSEEIVTKPLCGRVFHYMRDDFVVAWNNTKAIPARKLRSIPKVYLRHLDPKGQLQMGQGQGQSQNQTTPPNRGQNMTAGQGQHMGRGNSSASGNRTAGQQDMWYTLVLLHYRNESDIERPYVHWVVSNIRNFEIHTGDCAVAYQPILPPMGKVNALFLLYKQSRRVEIEAGDYAEDNKCTSQFRCAWNMEKLVDENDLDLVGALSYHVESDPYAVAEWVEAKLIDAEEGCTRLAEYKHEGRMLGQCLSKFDAWKALKQELEKCVVEFKKKMIMKQMSMMCPELGSHFSEEKGKWGDENKEEANDRAMGEYDKGRKDNRNSPMGDIGDDQMEMMVKYFVMAAMKKIGMKEGEGKQEPGSDVMKPGDEMIGPHCVQVVVKYISHMKMKMMKEKDGRENEDDEMDGMEGGKCLEAAKMFMKEMWEKRQKDKAMEGGDWEKWRKAEMWGKKDEEKDKWEKMMKEMWENKEDKGEGEHEDMKKMWEKIMGGMQDKEEGMGEWQGKWEQQTMKDMKEKFMKEIVMKVHEMLFGDAGGKQKTEMEEWEAKWKKWQSWKKKSNDDEEEVKMQKWIMEIKKKMMMEKMKKIITMLKEKQEMDQWKEKWASWKNWEDKERWGREKEAMIQEIKKKMMMKVFEMLLQHGEKEEDGDKKMKEMKEKIMGFIKMMVMAKKQFEDKMEEMKKKMMMMKLFEKLLCGDVDEEESGKDEKMREMKEKVMKMFKMLMGEKEDDKEDKFKEILEMMKMFEKMKEKKEDKEEKYKKIKEEMWGNGNEGEMKEMWEKIMGGMQDKEEGMGEWQGKWEQQTMKDMKEKFMKEIVMKVHEMLFGDAEGKQKTEMEEWEAKWKKWQSWKKKSNDDEEEMKMQKWIMEIKKKMMMEKMKKIIAMLKEKQEMDQWKEKWASWKKWEDKERWGREKEAMIQEIKKKMMMKVFEMLLQHGEKEEDGDKKMKEMKEKIMGFIKMMVMAKKQFEDKMEEMKKKMMMMKLFEKLLCGDVDEEESDKDEKMREMKEKVMKMFKMLMGEKEDDKEDKMKDIHEMMKMFEKMKEKKEDKEEKYKKMMEEMWNKMKDEKEDKWKWGEMMEEMAKKWDEGDDIGEEEKKAKKMVFLVNAFKAFLKKHMAMKEKLQMFEEYFKKMMMMEERCPFTDEPTGREGEKDEEKNKCLMMLKEMMMKKKVMEMLKEKFMDMEEEEDSKMSKEKSEFIKKMVQGIMNHDEM